MRAPRHIRHRRLACALCAWLLLLGAGCAHVAPYEREQLSRPTMDLGERERMRGFFVAHVFDAREGAIGATDQAGGGCGCN